MTHENANRFPGQVLNDEALCARMMEKEPYVVATMAREPGFDLTMEER